MTIGRARSRCCRRLEFPIAPGVLPVDGQRHHGVWRSRMDAVAATPVPDPPTGRPYDGTLRRERAAETREKILDAGSELIHRTSVRDWKRLTVRAVAERAGVNERTVYRYFGSERGLRDAVMHRNEQEAGIELDGMGVEDIATVAAQIFDHVAQYPREPRPPLEPTLVAAKDRQQEALLRPSPWRPRVGRTEDRLVAGRRASMCCGVWPAYERLVVDWDDRPRPGRRRGSAWVIGLVEEAVRKVGGPA